MSSYSMDYHFLFPITSENYVEKILDFDVVFMKNAHKYRLMYLGNIDINQFLELYKNERKYDFFDKEFVNYYLFDITYINQFLLKFCGLRIQYNGYSVEKYIQTFRNKEIVHQSIRFFDFVNMSDFYARDLEGLDFWQENAGILLFFDSKDLHLMPYNTKIEYIPRFNSFLREISIFVKQMGGKIETYSMPSEFMTIEGFLLNGKIIYQEDIDEGREIVPITPAPNIPYWLELE